MKHTLVVLGVTLLFGCTTKTYVVADFPPSSTRLAIQDLRVPDSLKDRNVCETHQIGDVNLTPARLDVLQHRLVEQLGPEILDRSVKVSKFDIVVVKPNMCRIARGALVASVSYPAGIIVAGGGVPEDDGVVCEIVGTIDDERFSAAIFKADQKGVNDLYGFSASGEKIGATIRELLQSCVDAAIESIHVQAGA